MDAFSLHHHVISDYHNYVVSFINIAAPRIRTFVAERLVAGDMWPEPLLQLNLAYTHAHSVKDLVVENLLYLAIADILRDRDGRPFILYRIRFHVTQ